MVMFPFVFPEKRLPLLAGNSAYQPPLLLLPGLLTLYHQRFPMMELRLLENSSAQLEQLAWEGRLDLAILHRPFRDYGLEYISLCREEFYLAVPPDDPDYLAASAGGDSLPLFTAQILSRKSFNMLTPNQRSRQVADNICAAAGIVPKILYSTTSFATSLALTANGIGAAVWYEFPTPVPCQRPYTSHSSMLTVSRRVESDISIHRLR